VFTNEPLNNVPTPLAYDGEKMSDLDITTEKIEKHLLGLNPNKSAGPDGIHSRVLQVIEQYKQSDPKLGKGILGWKNYNYQWK
jgi:hypothetical protein